MSNPVICGVDFDDFVISMEEFHGYRSPGILLGGLMIEASLDELGDTPYLMWPPKRLSAFRTRFSYSLHALSETVFYRRSTGENSPSPVTTA